MKKIVITAGGTSEKIDNVRKITNSSTGKLGMIIANQFLEELEDVKVYYVCSKNSLKPIDERVEIIEIDGTNELKERIEDLLVNNSIDYFVHSMAVSDYTTDYVTSLNRIKESLINNSAIETISCNKISSYEDNLVIVLKPTPKIISIIKDISPSTYLVGFKLLDGVTKDELIEVAKKLRDKNNCDLVIANDLSNIREGNHNAYIIDKDNNVIEVNGKEEIAKKLVRRIKYEKNI